MRHAITTVALSCLLGVVACGKPQYERDFDTVAKELDGVSVGPTKEMGDRLDAEAPKHVVFLRQQLKSSDSGRRALAAAESGFTGDDSLAKDLYPVAQSDSNSFARIEALRSLAKMKVALAGAAAWQIVTGPYQKTVTEQAIRTLYQMDPKLAVRTFKRRLGDPAFGAEGAYYAPTLMTAYILASDPKAESAYVLKEVASLRATRRNSKWLDQLQADAEKHRVPTISDEYN